MKGSIHVRGSSTLLAPMQVAAEAFMAESGCIVPVSAGGTARGIRAMIDGLAHLAMASSDVDSDLKAYAAKQNQQLDVHVLAHDAIVPCVHPGNPVGALTLVQLHAVFAGEVTNWRQLGGPDRPIVPLSYDPYQGTFEAFSALVMAGDNITPRATILDPGELPSRLAQMADAIAYVPSGKVTGAIKALPVNGVAASVETIRAGRFPVVRALSVVTTAQASDATKAFVAFLLAPGKGQRFQADFGNVPVT